MYSYENNIRQLIAQNNKAHYEYFIEQTYEVGIVLTGTEVKSLRENKASIAESHVVEIKGEIFIIGCYIDEYTKANKFNHYPRRPRKLLLHSKEIKKLTGMVKKQGITIVPLSLYFNKKNLVKVLIAIAKGKKQHDKRETIKQRDWERQKARIFKEQ